MGCKLRREGSDTEDGEEEEMKRRAFIKGALGMAASTMVPGGDGVALESIAHPSDAWNVMDPPPPAFLPFVTDNDTGIFSTSGDKLEIVTGGVRMAKALAKSMNETREQMMANVLNRAFDLSPTSLEEIEVDIKRGGSSDKFRTRIADSDS